MMSANAGPVGAEDDAAGVSEGVVKVPDGAAGLGIGAKEPVVVDVELGEEAGSVEADAELF